MPAPLITDITSPEMAKYASNAFLATRISFINEMAALCDAVGALDRLAQASGADSGLLRSVIDVNNRQ